MLSYHINNKDIENVLIVTSNTNKSIQLVLPDGLSKKEINVLVEIMKPDEVDVAVAGNPLFYFKK